MAEYVRLVGERQRDHAKRLRSRKSGRSGSMHNLYLRPVRFLDAVTIAVLLKSMDEARMARVSERKRANG